MRLEAAPALGEACLRLLVELGHPVHYEMLAALVRANTRLTPTAGQVLLVLTILRSEGRVERVRVGVYCATPSRS